MTAISCPYCGAAMNLPLRFCVSCGRAFTGKESGKLGRLKAALRGGATKKLDDTQGASSFDRARRSYGFQKALRQFFINTFYVGSFILLYFVAVAYVMQDPKVAAMVRKLFSSPAQQQTTPGIKPEFQSDTAPPKQGTSITNHHPKPQARKHRH